MAPGASDPPRLARALLRLLVRGRDAEFVLGDLEEEYRHVLHRRGRVRAGAWFWWQAAGTVASWRRPAMPPLAAEVRLAFRGIVRRPAFTAAVVLTLALGVAPAVAVFSVVESVLLAPLPFHEPDRLVFLWRRLDRAPDERARVPLPDVADFRERSTAFEGIAATDHLAPAALEGAEGPAEAVRLGRVTPNFFALLGVDAALGRLFSEEDALPAPGRGGPDASGPREAALVVLSYELWRSRFGGDPSAVGRTVRLNGRSALVLGVLPRSFRLPLPPDVGLTDQAHVWAPLPRGALDRAQARDPLSRDQDSDETGVVVGRLGPGVSLARAREEISSVAAGLRRDLPDYREAGATVEVEPVAEDVVRHVRPVLIWILVGSLLTLLVACVNVAHLLMVRGAQRERETQVRLALGAGRMRLLGGGLVQAGTLAFAGVGAGAMVAAPSARLILRVAPAELRISQAAGLGPTTAGFTLVVALTVTALLALLSTPAVRDGRAAALLAGGSAAPPRTKARFRLTTSQVAMAAALLVGAGLLLRSARALGRVDPGFSATGVLTFELSLRDPERYRGPADRNRFTELLEERLAALAGVRAAGVTTVLPLSGGAWTNIYGLPGDAPDEWSRNEASFRMATPGYFAALGIPVLAGRPFTRADDTERRRVVVVDQAMAVRLAGAGQDPGSVVGRRLAFPLDGRPVEAEIVGVVGSVRDPTLFARGRPTFYVPYRHEASRTVAVAVRGTGDPALLAPAVRRVVEEVDPHLPLQRVRTLSSYLREQSAPVRFALLLMGAFAGSAILLSGVGLYGSVSQALVSRRRELGVRMALGAQPERLVADAVREGMRSALAGIAIGLLLAAPFAMVVRRLVYGVAPADPLAWSGAAATLTVVALVACWLSARAITRLEVTEALRSA